MLILNIPLSILHLCYGLCHAVCHQNVFPANLLHLENSRTPWERVDGYIEEMMDGQKVVKVFVMRNRP